MRILLTFAKNPGHAALYDGNFDGKNIGNNFALCKRAAVEQRKDGTITHLLVRFQQFGLLKSDKANSTDQVVDTYAALSECYSLN